MKIIDILNKKANGTLEDGFKFKYDGNIYQYNKEKEDIRDKEGWVWGGVYVLEMHLNEEIEEQKKIETLPEFEILDTYNWSDVKLNRIKINELVQLVNNLIKESEK